jgi:peptide deformylase
MKAREVTEFDDFLIQLVERMHHLMEDAQGVGLAATQLGVLQRVFVFEPEEEKGMRAVVNPQIVESSSDKLTEEEGCLSLQEVRVPVERPNKVTIEGKDPSGDDVRYELEGLSARIVQHEYDHLDGVLIIDRTDPESRKQALGTLRPQPSFV